MAERTTTNIYNQSIFGPRRERGYGFSNVHDVFRKTSPEQVDSIAAFYGTRCAHVPDNTEVTGVIVEQKTPRIKTHYEEYVAKVLNKRTFEVEDIESLNGIHRGALVVPFINTSHVEEQFRIRGLDVWGLPGMVVDIHKNKADCHKLIDTLAIPGFQTPDYRVVHIDKFSGDVSEYIAHIKRQYSETGMDDFTPGVMVRSAESDGNYGGGFIKLEENGYTLTKNGSDEDKQTFATEAEVLKATEKYLRETGNGRPDVEPRVVVSRLMDLADSPGISAVLINGEIVTLPWNGQVQEANSTACSGTTSYNPGTDYLRQVHRDMGEPTTKAFERFIEASLRQFRFDQSQINGVINVDLMIPGAREIEFQRRLGRQAGITIAEINPRFTNWTDALAFVAAANGEVISINNMLSTISHGVYTQDKYHFEPGFDMTIARNEIAKLDSKLKEEQTRILVRMIDEKKATMGLVFSGDIAKARKELDNLKKSLK